MTVSAPEIINLGLVIDVTLFLWKSWGCDSQNIFILGRSVNFVSLECKKVSIQMANVKILYHGRMEPTAVVFPWFGLIREKILIELWVEAIIGLGADYF